MSAVAAPQVLRYWLALLRHEEALAVRPRARKVNHALELTAEQMLTPSAGQDYVKLPFSQQGNFLVDAQGSLEVPVEAECAAFFEAWLASQYRYGAEDGRLEHLVCFPALLLPRQELAGLVRFPVHIDWRTADGKRFTPPSASDRAKKQLPPPPRILSLRATKQDPDSLPFFIDGSLLRETLRVDFERIEAFFSAVKRESPDARQLLRRLCDLLRDQMASDDDLAPAPPLASGGELASSSAPGDAEVNDLLAELFILTDKRLTQCGAKGKAYEIAILLDASRNRASFHVQRDLQAALEQFQSGEMKSDSPLTCYLGQRKAVSSVRPLLGRFGDLGLTQSQRRAGERYLGSALCAVQGPPGTGKTHLILNLAAQQLIDNVTSLIKSEHPGQKLLIVTSTNNRAVDNVVFPLGRDLPGDVLPFALRVGSRDVVEKVTVVELQRAQRWLERRTVASDDEWEAAKNHLARLLAELEGEIEPSYSTQRARIALQQGARELLELEAELAVLDRTPLSDAAAVACGIDLVHVASAASELRPLLLAFVERLLVLSSLSEAEKKTPLVLIEQSYKLTLQRQGEPMEQLLGSALSWGLPPRFPSRAKADDKREAWEEGAEAALHQARALLELVEELAKRAAVRSRANELRDQLASRAKSVRGDDSVEQGVEQLEPRLHELWTAACRVREL